MAPQSNVWLGNLGWFGPSYPEAGDPPVAGFGPTGQDGDMPDLDELAADSGRGGEPDSPAPPPRHGPGSGKSAWAAYARQIGVEVDPDATRDDIIDAVDRAGSSG